MENSEKILLKNNLNPAFESVNLYFLTPFKLTVKKGRNMLLPLLIFFMIKIFKTVLFF